MFNEILRSISRAIKELGKGTTVFTVMLALIILACLNYKTLINDGIEFYESIKKEKHEEDMLLRDTLLKNLDVTLREMRAAVGADRLLYFEYHNSKENFIGIPFKYVDLVIAEKKYGVPGIQSYRYKDINAGLITDLYTSMVDSTVLVNDGSETFYEKYSNAADFLGEEYNPSLRQMYVNLAGNEGTDMSLGFIVLEWSEDPEPGWDYVKRKVTNLCLPKLNTMIDLFVVKRRGRLE